MSATRSLPLALIVAGLAAATTTKPVRAAEPELVSVTKIWDKGKHNAFTDLIRWHGQWYCTFSEADAHVGGDGQLRVLTSADGVKWEPVALVAEKDVDLRDPKLSITPDDRLMIVAGGSVYKGGKTLLGRQTRVTFSRDGRNWTPPQRVLGEGEWLWRVTWHEGRAYGISSNAGARQTPEAKEAAKSSEPVSSEPADWKLKLVVSDDGVKYDLITHLGVPGHPNETTLRFLPNGEMMAMVRREGGDTFGWLGTSQPPYKDWKWQATKHRFGGPNFIRLPHGGLWGVSRSYPDGPKTVLARLSRDSYEPALTLPSGGDTSYAGLVWHDGLLWMSYYSSHENQQSAIYLAKIRLPANPIDIGSRRELFVDDFLIEKLTGTAKQVVQQPTPREVALTADKPWEGNTSAYFTVFRDADLLRMYYRGSHFDEKTKQATHPEVTCYAESKDGIIWTKPELGLYEFDGSKKNSIVWMGPGAHNFTPFKDMNPQYAPGTKYKALASGKGGLLAFKSADGIRWSLLQEGAVITKGAFDSQNLAFWDAEAGCYRDFHRGTVGGVRSIMTCTSTDFVRWTNPTYLEFSGGAPREQLYTNAILPYERAPHLLLGFPTRFLPEKQQTEPTFMSSRDGQQFQCWPEAVIPRTAPQDRDGNRSNYMAWGIVELPGKEKELSVYAKEAYYTGTGSRLRRFSYRVDGFVAVHAPAEGGELISRPLRFSGEKLQINFTTATKGSVRVELQDAVGKPIAGFGLEDCRPLQGDAVEQTVGWKNGSDLDALAGKVVRLRFELKDADLFSFRFR